MTPIYSFECVEHGQFEQVYRIGEMPEQVQCQWCDKSAIRVYHPTPTIFKAKGFYKTGE